MRFFDGSEDMKETLGIGIVGAGQIVKRHALAYRSLQGLARMTAVADLDRRRAQRAKEQFKIAEVCENHHQLLSRDDIHVIDVCTPAGSHAKIVLDAIRAGKHVLWTRVASSTPITRT